jgi:hypothetical protein
VRFTDEDLKRLKDYIAAYTPEMRVAENLEGNAFDFDEVEALLCRLEAAERYIDNPCLTYKNAWRKAAGK